MNLFTEMSLLCLMFIGLFKVINCVLKSSYYSYIYEFKPRRWSAKNRFQVRPGSNLETLNTFWSGTNHIWAASVSHYSQIFRKLFVCLFKAFLHVISFEYIQKLIYFNFAKVFKGIKHRLQTYLYNFAIWRCSLYDIKSQRYKV